MEGNFPDRLKKLRDQKNWTKVQTAKKIGITPGAYGNYEYGNREPNIDTLIKISNIFDVSTLYLLEGKYTSDDMDRRRKNEVWEMSDWFKGHDNSNIESVIRFCVEFLNNKNKYDPESIFAIEKLFQLLTKLQNSKINDQTIKTQTENFIGVFLQNLNYMVDNKSTEELEKFFKEVIVKTDYPS